MFLRKRRDKAGNILRATSGATAIEYGLMMALMAVVIIVGLRATGTSTDAMYENIKENFDAAHGGGGGS